MFTFNWLHKQIPWTRQLSCKRSAILNYFWTPKDKFAEWSHSAGVQTHCCSNEQNILYLLYTVYIPNHTNQLSNLLGSKNCKQNSNNQDTDGVTCHPFSQPAPNTYCHVSTYTVYGLPWFCCTDCQSICWCFLMSWVVSSAWLLSPPLVGLNNLSKSISHWERLPLIRVKETLCIYCMAIF